ncbi:MAG: 1,4-alpha-glucan branching protein domain-containing protein, partial [Candidatus Omnitrophota bacterium]
MITPLGYLHEYPTNQMSLPSASSWGYKGYNEFWVEGSNDWLYRHLYKAGERMQQLAETFSFCLKKKAQSIQKRALNQAARELLLAQASDWAFIMKTGTMVAYAQKRVSLHIGRFTRLYEDLVNDSIDPGWLESIEARDNIFSSMDCASYYLRDCRGDKDENKRRVNERSN